MRRAMPVRTPPSRPSSTPEDWMTSVDGRRDCLEGGAVA
jgi:hypothetical protein